MESIEKQFFFSQYQVLDVIRETAQNKVERIFYNPRQSVCVLKIYYGRNLEAIYLKLKKIHHLNLATVYDVLYCDGNTYIVEENIDGETLAEHLQMEGVFSEKEVISIIKEICDGLDLLHGQNPPLIHRDIKPSNIMLRSDGSVKLIDFDTVRCYKEAENQDTILLGTKEYASPEHYGYGQTGVSSDIYSIGVTMHEMLTGKILENHKAIYKGKLLPVIKHCIQMDSTKRFHSVQELKKVLSTYESPWGVLSRNRKKMGMFCVMFLGIISAVILLNGRQEQWPNLQEIYQNEESPQLLLENKKVDKKLKELLGIKYSYVKECLYSISDEVKYLDGRYFMKGAMPGMYTLMEASVALGEDGTLECAFLQDGVCHYYASTIDLYDTPSWYMQDWMFSYEDDTIQFHKETLDRQLYENTKVNIAVNSISEEVIPVTYIREDSSAYIVIDKPKGGNYAVKGTASWGINTGELDGTLSQLNAQQYLYKEARADGEIYAELKLVMIDGNIYAKTLKGEFGGLNVRFDGTYKKQ